ncbi:11145_t:CDS:2 [Gigaspora margarita]|uniref:11145_t:CDS:1 n=1 Tax=Gigaspora margarita TaxID=4874 RepID=A0ABM8W236_GIGMA|nr:11145_t:CDS:2 [Gigaspora margarita]
MLYLLVQVNKGPKSIIPERIMSIESESNQFFDLFDAVTLGQYEDREVKVFIRREKSEGWREVDNGLNGNLKMLEVLGFMQVKFCLIPIINVNASGSTQNEHDAFSILMRNSKKPLLPQCCTERKTFIIHLASALWYIDPHLSTLSAHGRSYNEFYYTGRHKKVPLSQQKLAHLSNSLEISISQPWASNNRWSQVMPAVLSLIKILKKYSDYLITTNASMNELHHSNESARSPENNSTMYRVNACEPYQLKDEYIQLDDLLFEKSVYEHVEIQQYLPNNATDRYRFMKEVQLTFPIGVYRYYQGNYLGTINYIWRIPENEESNDETLKARMLAKIHEELPRYFTRQIKKNVLEKYSYIQKVTLAVLQILHFDLTGNAAVTSNAISRDVEERLQLMLLLADPNIIFDLRTNNGFKGTKFNIFWDETKAYFNEQIHLQFCPANATTTQVMYYTGRFSVKFKVQSQMLQKSSEDAHYCAALFKYLREFCIQYCQWTCLISANDKHKIPIGEDVAVSTGVRNQRTIVSQESILAAADHDFSKLSLTPSVIFFISIPNDISGSFYDGQVFVSYKDTVFEPSTAIRHSAEFLKVLNIQYACQVMPPILCVALKHDLMSPKSELLFGISNTLDDIRKKAQESIN